jgi:hypothetical protein
MTQIELTATKTPGISDTMVTKMEAKHPSFSFFFEYIHPHIILPDEQQPQHRNGMILCGSRGLAQWGL